MDAQLYMVTARETRNVVPIFVVQIGTNSVEMYIIYHTAPETSICSSGWPSLGVILSHGPETDFLGENLYKIVSSLSLGLLLGIRQGLVSQKLNRAYVGFELLAPPSLAHRQQLVGNVGVRLQTHLEAFRVDNFNGPECG